MDQSRSSQRYRPLTDEEEQRLIAEILAVMAEHPRYGYRMVWATLRHVDRGEQRRRAVALVIVGHRAATDWVDRQALWCAAQMRCTLALLTPTALAIDRVLQCVAASGFS